MNLTMALRALVLVLALPAFAQEAPPVQPAAQGQALAAPTLLKGPLYLGAEPPELRALQFMAFPHVGVEGLPPGVDMTREAALGAAQQILAAIHEQGASFPDIGRRVMRGRSLELGSFAQGMLPPAMDAWLFASEVDAISAPLDTPFGVALLRRVPAWAGARTILLTGEGAEQRSLEVMRLLQAGEPFAEVAQRFSDDVEARERGGATMIYQRGASDKLLKGACFDMEPGVWRGPMESPLGYHFVLRVTPESLEGLAPRERTCVRLRALVVAHVEVPGSPAVRTREEAFTLAMALAQRLGAGEPLASLARELNDDPGGVERAGDLGWVFRSDPRRPEWTEQALTRPVGWVSPQPLVTPTGYVLVARDA
ncbi:MAG: peptidylprolyl isomerase [Planctomycetota bacterium]